MHQGQLVFAQLMRHLPLTTFRRCVVRYVEMSRATPSPTPMRPAIGVSTQASPSG